MMTTITEATGDPHGLGDTAEPLADEAELRVRFGVSGTWLRRARRRRWVRYVDLTPTAPPGRDAGARYLYCVADIVRERARVPAASPTPTQSPAPPLQNARPPTPSPTIGPEVIVVRRRRAS